MTSRFWHTCTSPNLGTEWARVEAWADQGDEPAVCDQHGNVLVVIDACIVAGRPETATLAEER